MIATPRKIVYPSSDGEPIAENTVQFDWIFLLKWNIDVMFGDRADVSVAADNFIYPIEGEPKIALAPDVYIVFGRPKGDCASYKVWEEAGIFPQVIFEVLAPLNRFGEMLKKLQYYERFGAEEYYVLQPNGEMALEGWRRVADKLEQIPTDDMIDFISPRLNVHFVTNAGVVEVYGPDGKKWDTPLAMVRESNELRDKAEKRAEESEEKAMLAYAERDSIQSERDRLAAKLRELGLDPDTLK